MNTSLDPRLLLERATGQFAALVATVEPSRFDDRTPCTEYTIRALIGHVLGNTLAYACIAEGGSVADEPGDIKEVPDDDWAAAYKASGERLTAAGRGLTDGALDGIVDLGFAKMPMRAALGAIVMEIATHTWDLREALGASPELDQELAEFSLAYAQDALPPARRGAPAPFEPVQPAPEGVDTYGRLAAWLGRKVPAGTPGV
ncbi:TIGR03086 family metal-binding protein [Streptomyces lydicus]|uniref:TIGR03086 family metal-binding protein n=1 Tax=Streptomyces lydicus TaxID=47763 RepID=UPI00101183D8|nr:TIGR03086 family metal-binding protein [Streptomyces lydicus]MCZ1006706.1 TIGR03086 family metal-binding protein [Streptomyces lydicus]